MLSILETIRRHDSLRGFNAAVKVAAAETMFSGSALTVFAPHDHAFARLSEDLLDVFFARPELLSDLIAHHVLPSRIGSAELYILSAIPTLGSSILLPSSCRSFPAVSKARITAPDIVCSNGIVHIIDGVLIPKILAKSAPSLAAML